MPRTKYYLSYDSHYYCSLTFRDCPNLKERASEGCSACEILAERKRRKREEQVK